MQPILFTVGPLPVSSFGVFLSLAIFFAVFTAWRLARIYDLHEERVIDLAILTTIGGLIGARIFYVASHWNLFGTLEKSIEINRYPGLSFWGGALAGFLVLRFFAARLKINFWQIADFAAVSLLLGIAIGDWGCFFGGCSFGVVSNLPIATSVVGIIGKRLPITVIESLLITLVFLKLWKQSLRFHFPGKIFSWSLMSLGTIKLITENYRGESQGINYLYASIVLLLGITIFYKQSKRNLVKDIKGVFASFFVSKKRQVMLCKLRRSWYNRKVGWKVKSSKISQGISSFPKKIALKRATRG